MLAPLCELLSLEVCYQFGAPAFAGGGTVTSACEDGQRRNTDRLWCVRGGSGDGHPRHGSRCGLGNGGRVGKAKEASIACNEQLILHKAKGTAHDQESVGQNSLRFPDTPVPHQPYRHHGCR